MDIVTLGEIMLRFTAPPPQVLEQAPLFEVRAAGAESNVAIAARRMGLQTGWISRLPDNALGRRAAASVQQHGVDISRVVWTPQGRMGTYYIENSVPPRAHNVIYDRAFSAFTELTVAEVDWDYFASARLFHVTGITVALSTGVAEVVRHALRLAREKQMLISFDLNYRAKLWPPDAARCALDPLLSGVDILRAGLDEAHLVFEIPGDAATVAEVLYRRYQPRVVVITDEGNSVVAYDGQFHRRTPYPVQVVDSIGAGDAFMAGFLCGYLERGVEWGLDMAAALGALKHTYLGDNPWCTRDDVIALIEQRQDSFR